MSNARIDRMLRELESEPSQQFFSVLFGLVGLGNPGKKPVTGDVTIPVSLLKNAAAR